MPLIQRLQGSWVAKKMQSFVSGLGDEERGAEGEDETGGGLEEKKGLLRCCSEYMTARLTYSSK